MKNLFYNNMFFSNKVSINLYKSIAHIVPSIQTTRPIEEEDVLFLIKQLCDSRQYKYPKYNTFFYDDKYRFILYEHKDKTIFGNEINKRYMTLGWDDEYTYLKNNSDGHFIYI